MAAQTPVIEFKRGNYTISTDKSRLDEEVIRDFLANESYWARGIPMSRVHTSIENSLCFGLYDGDGQIGFARVISDCAVIAYLSDVFILERYRGRGLAKWLTECVLSHPDLQGLHRWVLVTEDAHGLYARYGFKPLSRPGTFMELTGQAEHR